MAMEWAGGLSGLNIAFESVTENALSLQRRL